MNDFAGIFEAAKRPNWPLAGCVGASIFLILTSGLGRDIEVADVGKRPNCEIVDVGKDLDSFGRYIYNISEGQFEGTFGGETDRR